MSVLVTPAEFTVGETYTIASHSFTVTALAEGPVERYDGPTVAVTCADGRVRNYAARWRAFRPSSVSSKAVSYTGAGGCGCTDARTTVTVPPVFFEDHARRGCLAHDTEGVRLAGGIRVPLCPTDLADLRSDAEHYAGSARDYGPEFAGLVTSARATVRRLRP